MSVLVLHVLALDAWLHAPGVTPAAVRPDTVVSIRSMDAPPHRITSPAAPSATAVAPPPAPRLARPTTAHPPTEHPDPFLPAAWLDRRPTPVSAPDPRWLDALADQPISGLPVRLRLFISATGSVVGVEPVDIGELDAFALPALQAMFRNTAFVPGRYQGRDVASQIELELQLDGMAQ